MPDDSPTSRALQALALIQARPGIPAQDLADRLGVTTRAVRRCVATLRDAGVPVAARSGPDGGYRIGRGVRMPPMLFSEAEALGLTMAVLPDAGTDGPLASALDKLVQALPGRVGEQATLMRRTAVASRAVAAAEPPDPRTGIALVRAVAERRVVTITYAAASGRVAERTLDPWAVVARRRRWYLVARDHRPDAVRTLRLDRVRAVEVLDRAAHPPADLDPAALLEEHLGAGWTHETRVVFDRPPEEVRRFCGPVMGTLAPHPGGCVLTGTTDNPEMYAAEWLAGVPLPFRVEGGPELREAVARTAERLRASLG